MWQVLFTAKAEHEIKEQVKLGLLTDEDREVISTWIKQVKEFGPDSLAQGHFWHDHSLEDNWKGHRSSAFSYRGRIIYKIEDKKITVIVVRLTSSHDYRS